MSSLPSKHLYCLIDFMPTMERKIQQRNAVEDALRGFRMVGKIDCSGIEVMQDNGLWWIEMLVPMEDGRYPENEISNIRRQLIDCFDYDESDLKIGDNVKNPDMIFQTENPATSHVKLQVVDRR